MKYKSWFLWFLFCLPVFGRYYETDITKNIKLYISPEVPADGQAAVVKLYHLDIARQYKLILFTPKKQIYPIYEIDDFTSFLIGIPLGSEKIRYKFYEDNILLKTGTFRIQKKQYPKTSLTVKKRFTEKNKRLYKRIAREQKKLRHARAVFSSVRFWGNVLCPPVPLDRISSPFGTSRIFNHKQKSVHLGVDLPRAAGTPIHSIFPGRIICTGNFYYGGNTVLIDHGLGVISTYAHLSEISVKEGELVYAGQVIGKVGMTGRATGPHLHWGISINTIPVDPITFISNIRFY